MIIFMAPSRICVSNSFGIPLCCRPYGKIVYSSRSKSALVNTAPFTRATGESCAFCCTEGTGDAGALLNTVGACDVTCAETADTPVRKRKRDVNLYFIWVTPGSKKQGRERSPSPHA